MVSIANETDILATSCGAKVQSNSPMEARMKSRFRSQAVFVVLALFLTPTFSNAQTPCTPGISFWKLLDSVRIGYIDGRLNLEKLYAVCLPAPIKRNGSSFPYEPDGGGKLSTQVKTADGTVLNTYVWYASSIGGLWELGNYKVLGGFEAIKPLTAGNYQLEFALEDKPFYVFPFSVSEMKNDDPYQAAGLRYFIEGAWNEYGNVFYQRNDPASTLRFTTWLQDKSGHVRKESVPSDIKLIRLRDNKVIGEAVDQLRLEPRWQQADFFFAPPGGDKNSYLKASDLLSEDGRYSVRLSVDGTSYGDYSFVVKGGLIQLQGRQIKEGTNPMHQIVDYLSGGRYTSWWIKRELK
jgi:hypothetical protein